MDEYGWTTNIQNPKIKSKSWTNMGGQPKFKTLKQSPNHGRTNIQSIVLNKQYGWTTNV